MARAKTDRTRVFQMLALGWNKARVRQESGVSERTYFRALREFQELPIEAAERIQVEAQQNLTDRIFDKKAWFDLKTCKSKIEVIQRWYNVMILRGVSHGLILQRLSTFRSICLGHGLFDWKVHPKDFTEEHGIKLIATLKSRNVSDFHARLVIRSFLLFGKGIVPTVISGQKASYGCMAKEYFTDSEVQSIFSIVDNLPESESVPLKTCLLFLLHTATRITATLRLTEEDLIWEDSEITQVCIVDKGRQGRKEKTKTLVPVLREAMKRFLAWRRKWNIRSKRLFCLKQNGIFVNCEFLRDRLREIYALALPNRVVFQPCHVWRHTFAMHYLRKTGWNYDLVALLGGWEDTKILKDCYGRPETKDIIAFIEKLEGGEDFGTKILVP